MTPSPPAHPTVVTHRVVDSPIGPLFLAAADGALVRLAFPDADPDRVLADIASRIGPPDENPDPVLERAAVQLTEYFAGTRRDFDVPLDLRLSAGFRRTVQEFLTTIGYGQTLTYTQVAAQVGHPQAVRAVGSACATNPLAIFVPCHRVLRSDGSPGGYAGGPDVKRALLALERDQQDPR